MPERFAVTNRTGQLVEPVLTNLARNYRPSGFIADIVAPRIAVEKEVGKYPVWEPRDFFTTDVDPLVPDRAETKEIDVSLSTEPYVAEEYALKVSISKREEANADSQVRLREQKQAALQDQLALHREVRVANLLRKVASGGKLNLGATPSNNWNVDAGTIESDIVTGKEAVYDAIGIEPTHIVIPYKVANAISIQQDIREIFKYTVDGRQLIGAGANILPPEIWGLKVLIPRGRRTTNAEGATNAFEDVWGDDVRILYVSDGPNLYTPSVAHTFQAAPRETTTWRENDPQVTYIRTSDGILDERVVAPDAGYEIKDVLS